MVVVEAKKCVGSKTFEISVDFEEAIKIKTGEGDITNALNSNGIYYNVKEGTMASNLDLKNAFGTTDLHEVAEKIIKEGELQKPQEFRDAEKGRKIKQIVDLILRNAADQHGRSYTEERIKRGIQEIHYHFDNRPAEQQMLDVVEKLKPIIPISIQVKKIKLTIPAQYTGKVYGILQDYKDNEEWLPNGDLEVTIHIPAGMQLDFYDKLNGITHGAVRSEEVLK